MFQRNPMAATALQAMILISMTLVSAQLPLTNTTGFFNCTNGRSQMDATIVTASSADLCLDACRNAATCQAAYFNAIHYYTDRCLMYTATAVSSGQTDNGDIFGWVCDKCQPGMFCPSGTALSCGYGFTSPAGASSQSQCACAAGFYRVGANCVLCPDGRFCAGGTAAPTACTAGTSCLFFIS
jgi:hypothetical protein